MTEPLEPPAASTAASAAATAPRARQRRLSTVSLASGVDLDRTVAAAPLFDVIQELVQHEAAADVPFPSVYCPPSLLAFDEPTDGGGGGGSDDGGGVDGAAATVRQRPEDPAALREEGRKLRGEVTYWKHQAEKKVRGGGGGGGGDGNLLGEPTGDCGGLQLSMVGSGPPGDNIADDVRRLRSEAARWRRRAESTAGRGDSTAAAAAAVALASPTTGRRRASTTLERHEVAAAAAAAGKPLFAPMLTSLGHLVDQYRALQRPESFQLALTVQQLHEAVCAHASLALYAALVDHNEVEEKKKARLAHIDAVEKRIAEERKAAKATFDAEQAAADEAAATAATAAAAAAVPGDGDDDQAVKDAAAAAAS
eukprot:Rhum_TRINITY_DN14618_c31_g1::Rhum_TRINITY_DN14618_c31_g1_i1::g.106133::m.106133